MLGKRNRTPQKVAAERQAHPQPVNMTQIAEQPEPLIAQPASELRGARAVAVQRFVSPLRSYHQEASVTIYHGDCREIIPQLENFDLLLTDPPYGLDKTWTQQWTNGRKYKSKLWSGDVPEWDKEIAELPLLRSAIEKCANSIVWGGNYYPLPPMRCWLSWFKGSGFTSGDFEMAWTTLDMPTRQRYISRVEANCGQDITRQHPTQKPMELMLWCLQLAGNVKTILDPFAGSGTTGRAAKDLGKKCVLIEREERYCEIAARRLSQDVLALGEG